MNTESLTLAMLEAFIAIGNKDSQATQEEVAKRAGFDAKLLGKETKIAPEEYTWTTPHGLLRIKNGKLSLLPKANEANLAASKIKKMETATSNGGATAQANQNPNALIVPLESIKVQKGFNVRKDFGDIEGLAKEIDAAGMWNPLTVRADGKGGYIITHGERRFRALQLLKERGVEFPGIEVMVIDPATTEAEIEATQLLQNDGKPLTIMEQGTVYARLEKLGWDNAKIAKKTGYTTEHIRNCKKLSEAPAEVKQAVESGEISGTAAIKLVKGTPDKAKQVEMLATAKAAPKTKQKGSKKITAKQLAGNTEKSKTSASEIVRRVKEVQDGMVVTQTAKKFSEKGLWEILQWILTEDGGAKAIKKLIL